MRAAFYGNKKISCLCSKRRFTKRIKEFQDKIEIYYVQAYSDERKISYGSILDIENLGVNFHGFHQGNMQMLIFLKSTECLWRTYVCQGSNGQDITRYSALGAGNSACICFDYNGLYKENAIFPTEISTINYDEITVKRLYDELKRTFRRQAVKTVNGCYICPKVYEQKEKYRFCTIDIKSPPEYGLKV